MTTPHWQPQPPDGRPGVGWRRTGETGEGEELRRLQARVAQLETLTAGLVDRCAAQSELLSRRAEGGSKP
jgi:hypothetical protein